MSTMTRPLTRDEARVVAYDLLTFPSTDLVEAVADLIEQRGYTSEAAAQLIRKQVLS